MREARIAFVSRKVDPRRDRVANFAGGSRPVSTRMQVSAARALNTYALQLEDEHLQLAREPAASRSVPGERCDARGARSSARCVHRSARLMVLLQRVKEGLSNDDESPPGAPRRPH